MAAVHLPSAMIFDDHDIRDDWNTSLSWRGRWRPTSWWHGRIVAGLASYWVYQHLGNLSPQERAERRDLAADRARRTTGERRSSTSAPMLDAFAERADAGSRQLPVELLPGFRTTARLIVVDSRAARELTPDDRAILDDEENWRGSTSQMRGGFRHVLVATSLPFLLPMGLHHVESWNEAVAQGAWGRPAARVGEKAASGRSISSTGRHSRTASSAVAGMVTRGRRRQARPGPATVTFLSGDVHYSFVSEVEREAGSRIVQAVCSPIRNPLPRLHALLRGRHVVRRGTPDRRRLARSAKVPRSAVPLAHRVRVRGSTTTSPCSRTVPDGLT